MQHRSGEECVALRVVDLNNGEVKIERESLEIADTDSTKMKSPCKGP
jgi:hypothetical protein